jgi:hypothetical protein
MNRGLHSGSSGLFKGMGSILQFLKRIEIFVYLILGGLTAWQIRRFVLAWQELRAAAFGLERESAQGRLNRSAVFVVLFLVAAVVEFGMVTFIAPAYASQEPLPTSTLNLLASPTTTLPAEEATLEPDASLPAQTEIAPAAGCIPGEVFITFPENDTTVRDIIEVTGTVDVPNFGFYKFEIAREDSDTWLTIQAGEELTVDGVLGTWDTTQLDPGRYRLRLVVVDSEGNQRQPCVVSIYVEQPTQE